MERSTRFLILLHIPDSVGTAETVAHALTMALSLLPPELRRTLTWDQGEELAQHQAITAQTQFEAPSETSLEAQRRTLAIAMRLGHS